MRKKPFKQFSGIFDSIFMSIIYFFLSAILLIILLPLMNIVSSSISSPKAVSSGQVGIWPVDISLVGFSAIFENKSILYGFMNSFIYTILGTLINIAMTLVAAYPLSRRDFIGRKPIMLIFTFTMLFSGGMIPTYLVVRSLGMLNTIWSMVIPNAMGVYMVILARTFLQNSVPLELYESAEIDGCNYIKMFFMITLPLSKALIAVITLMYAVGHWNSYFNALMYLTSQQKFPLQLVLRQILVLNQFDLTNMTSLQFDRMIDRQYLANLLKYSVIVVATVPVMILYPFVQKHFVKGVMLGSLKG